MTYFFNIENADCRLQSAIDAAIRYATDRRDAYITPEHLLLSIAKQLEFARVAEYFDDLAVLLENYIERTSERVPEHMEYDGPETTTNYTRLGMEAMMNALGAGRNETSVPHVVKSILQLDESYARNLLEDMASGDSVALLQRVIDAYGESGQKGTGNSSGMYDTDDSDIFDDESDYHSRENCWRDYVVCLNDYVGSHNPLIGRDRELERTIQVLCRKDKNNPLHVGEAGVGKTALAYGLAARIESGDVPERLSGSKIFSLDLAALMAGTQYRGEFEKRFKDVLSNVAKLADGGHAHIIYMDELHTIVGAGRTEGSTLDASNLLKPYLETGEIRFMGATTYDEYNRHVAGSKAFARRFEKIDVEEPSVTECVCILHGLKPKYEGYHGVRYTDEAIEYAVNGAAKYITGRFLPDKAIDLIDEAGAWAECDAHTGCDAHTVIGKRVISEVLAKVCHVEILSEERDDSERLADLDSRIRAQVFGQDEAVRELTEAVQLAASGLGDDDKPMASLLFVGPTGVGKTEVSRVLAKELGVPLLRFDMSEYVEKHTVAKLIGAPAGYVGYDDGGLLTDAIRKSPHCVLLFDEIEKAHPDIYNILLQVMDYGVLTDSKGQKADFRHVVFIMTTNCGAQYARQASVGFGSKAQSGEAMVRSVKKTFKPEFVNRLTAITVFRDMDREMASRILDKKLAELDSKLASKNATMHLTDSARDYMLAEGFSEQYGGREIDRVITSRLKPALMRAILFGELRGGGEATVDFKDGKLLITRL